MDNNFCTCICGESYVFGTVHTCKPYQSWPSLTPPSLDTNPLFLALLKRIENLEQRINDLQYNHDENKVATLIYG